MALSQDGLDADAVVAAIAELGDVLRPDLQEPAVVMGVRRHLTAATAAAESMKDVDSAVKVARMAYSLAQVLLWQGLAAEARGVLAESAITTACSCLTFGSPSLTQAEPHPRQSCVGVFAPGVDC